MLRQLLIGLGLLCVSAMALADLQRPLPANAVFQLGVKPLNASTIQLTWKIKSGYFLYQDRIHVMASAGTPIQLGQVDLPDPQIKLSKQHKSTLIYRDHLTLSVPFEAKTSGEIPLNIHFQGCSDQGFCYPPMNKTLILAVDKELKLRQVFIETTSPQSTLNIGQKKALTPTVEKPVEDLMIKIKRLFSSGNVLMIIITFFGFGLLLSLTPCVLPMIPVLSGMIVGHGPSMTTRKAIWLSISYVLSMSITYSVIGGVIALLGHNLQIQMQSPVAISCFSLLFVLLALSMFGVYDLRLPMTWQNRLARVTRHQSGGHYLNAALMGSLSILILSPCITPPLLGALSYIAQTGKLHLGLVALFFLGLGMGAPLILVGASAGKLLPKTGKWMNSVKCLFGVLLLGVAIHLMSRLLAPFYIMGLWALLLIFTGVACNPFANPPTVYEKGRQAVGLICLAYGLLILYGATAGHTNPLLPLTSPHTATSNQAQPLNKITVTTLAEAKQVLTQAKTQHKPVMLDFTATWCESCKILANTTLADPHVLGALQGMVWLEIDLTANNQQSLALLHHFKVIAPPTFQFYDVSGKDIDTLQLVGEVSVDTLLRHLNLLAQRLGQTVTLSF